MAFKSNIRAVRDYLGDNYGFQLSFKVSMTVYLLLIAPAALLFEFSDHYYFNVNRTKEYIRSFGQLVFMYFSYSIFIEIWRKQEDKYFNNFIEQYESSDMRSAYHGPYIRNLINDNINFSQTPNTY